MPERFVYRIQGLCRSSDVELSCLVNATKIHTRFEARQLLSCSGQHPGYVAIILSGWAVCYRTLDNGHRQITGILMAGDTCSAFPFLSTALDHKIESLTSGRLARVSHRALREMAQASPNLAKAFWRQATIMADIDREWLISLGRRSALERLAHLFCELTTRMDEAGLGEAPDYDMPIPQVDLADALGLSLVHVNRSLQELRARGLIDLRQRRLTIHDRRALAELALFDADYLRRRDEGDQFEELAASQAGLGVLAALDRSAA